MQSLYLALAMFLLLNLGVGMRRILRGPSIADHMFAIYVPLVSIQSLTAIYKQ